MHLFYRSLTAILFAVLTNQAAVTVKTPPAPASRGFHNAGAGANADAVWKKAGADEGLRQAFERAIYSLQDPGDGTRRGENHAQRLTLEFSGREARLSHPDGNVSFHLTGYGYGDRLQQPASAGPTGTGNRVEYQRGSLTEWYVNGSAGLEQGFTLAHRPGTRREGEPLVIAFGVTGGLLPAQDADGGSVLFRSSKGTVLRYTGLRALDARGRMLPSRLEVRGAEIRLIVEERDAQYPLVVDPTWMQQQELTSPSGGQYFGYSVSVSGDTAVIAENGNAYVFVLSAGVWSLYKPLAREGCYPLQGSVSVSGGTAVLGCPGNYGNFAYVFTLRGGLSNPSAGLTAWDGEASAQFGYSVSVSGDTVVIGDPSNNGQGAAYVFTLSGGVWTHGGKLIAGDGAQGDGFGYSVSVSGGTAVIGAPSKNNGQGAAYVSVLSGGSWSPPEELTASDGAPNDSFGYSVSVSGGTAVIGAPYKNGAQGAAYVFVLSGGKWGQEQPELTAPGDGNFGYSVSVSGDTAVIGAPNSGRAYVFVGSGDVWNQQELTASDGAPNDSFGWSVSVSGGTAVIGAPNLEPGAFTQAAYVFEGPQLATNSLLVGSAGGASSVVLSDCSTCAWTATANGSLSFLHIPSAKSASGTGSAVVVFTYDAFAGTGTRTGTLTIAGHTVTVTQAGTSYLEPGPWTQLYPTLGGLIQPIALAPDGSGNVYIADPGNNTIKEWSASTQQLITLVSSGLGEPVGVAVDGFGNVYIADIGNNAIEEWTASTGQLTTLVPSSSFQGLLEEFPTGVAVDGFGNVYFTTFAPGGAGAIDEWNASTGQLTLLASGLLSPTGVAVDGSGNVYIADSFLGIEEWSPATPATQPKLTPLVPPSSLLGPLLGVAVDGSGNVYIPNGGPSSTPGPAPVAIQKWSPATQQLTTLVSGLSLGYVRNAPIDGVAVDGSGNVYFANGFTEITSEIWEIPYAFVGPPSLTYGRAAGSYSLLPVLPATVPLTGIFAPKSSEPWLTIGTVANGVVNFSLAANPLVTPQTAQILLLGQQITVTQRGGPTELSPSTLAFGTVVDGVSSTLPATFQNDGATAVTIESIMVEGSNAGDFVWGGNCLNPLRAKSSCQITVTFTPSTAGSESATLSVASSSPTSPQAAALTGTGEAPPATELSPSTLAFGTVVDGASSALYTTFQNGGATAVTINSILVGGGNNPGDFVWAGNCPVSPNTLSAKSSCQISVTFTPSIAGIESAFLYVVSSSPASPQVAVLTGTGEAPPVTVSPSGLNFGAVAVGGTSAPQTVTLTNNQTVSLAIREVVASAGFQVASNTCGASIGAGDTCTVGVTFSPTAAGAATGTLTFTDGATNSPQVVSLTGTGAILTTLFSFDGSDGQGPRGALVQATDGNLYGTTFGGGANGNYGTIFKITPSGAQTLLYSFCSQPSCTDGQLPYAGLIQAIDGNLYGTTNYGGAHGFGTVFRIGLSGGNSFQTLYSFCSQSGCADGAYPWAGLIQAANGNFYGTAYAGGANGGGTLFQIAPNAGGTFSLTTLYNFCSQSGCTDGQQPIAGLIQATDGNFYGTTEDGGPTCAPTVSGCGTAFKFNPSTGTLTTLHGFCPQGECPDGEAPYAGLIQATNGDFYGTTVAGGLGLYDGTVFQIAPSGPSTFAITPLYNFCSLPLCADGQEPYAGLVQGTDGDFYGTTYQGGALDVGTLFKIAPSAGGTFSLTTLYSFCSQSGCTDGTVPYAGLIQATNGNFYGTTVAGGANNYNLGTVFMLSVGLGPFVETQPGSGAVGATVSILGNNLTGATSVTFSNNIPATTFTVNPTGTAISATVPAGATTGPVQVVTASGTKLSSNVPFQVVP
jgi:uncharacterized repeat protein (TIGR03803 family)